MCNCLSEAKARLKELPSKNKEYSELKIKGVYCEVAAFVFGNENKSELAIPFAIEHEPIRRKKTTVVNIIATYCPFCGVKYGG